MLPLTLASLLGEGASGDFSENDFSTMCKCVTEIKNQVKPVFSDSFFFPSSLPVCIWCMGEFAYLLR